MNENTKKYARVAVLFIISYAVLYALSALNILGQWNSLMYYLMPVPGFFLAYLGLDWFDEYFNFKTTSAKGFIAFAVVFFIVAVIAYYIALVFYYQNNVFLSSLGQGQQPALFDTIAQAADYVNTLFWTELKQSAYLVFALAAILGGVMRTALAGLKP